MLNLPDNVKAVKQTKAFDQNNIPAGLLNEHQLNTDTWGKIHILDGKLILQFLDSGDFEVLSKDRPGIVPPNVVHKVNALEDVTFYVEFWK